MSPAQPSILLSGTSPMRCTTGFELHHQYEIAETEKATLSSRRVSPTDRRSISEVEFVAAKQRYLESFANWLAHRAFCQDCKPKA